MRVGFVGLGLMGTPLALNILKGGFELTVWNRTEAKTEPLVAAGAIRANTISELTRSSDVVITMLTDAAASESVICGKDGILDHARPGLIVIDMGSIAPEMSRSIAERAKQRGVRNARRAGDRQSEGGRGRKTRRDDWR